MLRNTCSRKVAQTNSLAERVLFLGGSPCAGKSSVADALAERYSFDLYRCDEHFEAHAARATIEMQPVLHRIRDLRDDALWLRPVAELLADEITAYREEFPFVVEDLLAKRALSVDGCAILTEGAALLPDEVFARWGASARAVWMVPSPEFQCWHYGRREWAQEIAARCSDPQKAFANWMQRDIEFADWVEMRARALGYTCLRVDGSTDLVENIRWVEIELSLSPVKGGSA